jgi:hypothetical protein
MSKKKFTAGLESLFGDSPQETDQKGNLLLFPMEKKLEKKRKDFEKGSPSKKFANDIDSFLKEAFDEAFEEIQDPQNKKSTSGKKSNRPLTGLDALIRSTIEPVAPVEIDRDKSKRITFIVDREKLDKLKDIAKKEKAYLKDIIKNIVEEYVEKYEQGQGNDQ